MWRRLKGQPERASLPDLDRDKLHEECGVFGVFSAYQERPAADLVYLGLFALQHRGQESAGIAISDGTHLRVQKGMGLVAEVFGETELARLPGYLGIGHVRYSTTGESSPVNAQPLMGHTVHGQLALAHNGNLVNAAALRQELERKGSVFQTTTDSEVILNLIASYSDLELEEAVGAAVRRLQGGFALVIASRDRVIGVRDPHGIRPLCLGHLGSTQILASESCALGNLGAELEREVRPGEMVVLHPGGVKAKQVMEPAGPALCAFEFIYFSRPDTTLAGRNVHLVREAIGAELAREAQVEADVVIGAPDSGTSAAMGFARESGLPFELGLIKNRYIGRTFIQPTQAQRESGVRIKLTPVVEVLRGRRVVLIDDSIVRGTTSAKTVHLLREAGAREVHVCVASPPYRYPCFYGIDTSQTSELVAAHHTVEEIRQLIGATSLTYLSPQGLVRAIGLGEKDLCLACFLGNYPVPVTGPAVKGVFEGKEEGNGRERGLPPCRSGSGGRL